MKRGEEKKQAILNAAERLFCQKGYERASVQDILDALGTSKGSFYHHFETKLDVLKTLCEQRAQRMFAQYGERGGADALSQLNRLIYCMLPLRKDEEPFLRMLLPLLLRAEGDVIRCEFRRALRACFLPELARTLALCRAGGEAFYTLEELPALMFDLNTGCWERLAGYVAEQRAQGAPVAGGELLSIVQLYRFAWERLLDLPFGSVTVVRLEELLPLCVSLAQA